MRYSTRTADRAFLRARVADLHRDWQVGDVTAPYKTCNPPTTIVRFEGDVVYLADGTDMHRSHLRRVV